MKKIEEMKAKMDAMRAAAQQLLDDGKAADAAAKIEEIKSMKQAIEMQAALDAEEKEALKQDAQEHSDAARTNKISNKTKENASIVRAMIKKVSGRPLTEAENAMILPSTSAPAGENGEGYILPQDISTLIHKKIREYRSLRDVVGYMPAGALTGSFPVENYETVSELIDFTDGTDGAEDNEIKFSNVSYALKEKAAFIKLSNTLLAMSDTALITYVVEVFSKKAVVTENKLILQTLQKGKTVKPLATWMDLKSSLNKDLDPAMLYGTVIVTNQDGFDFLDSQLDTIGRPILQPNPSNSTQSLFKGYTVKVYSNAMLKTVGGKAPVFYGNLTEGVKFIDYQGLISFATSKEAGFMSNTTIARLIEFIDTVQVDASDKCYIYGQLPIAVPTK